MRTPQLLFLTCVLQWSCSSKITSGDARGSSDDGFETTDDNDETPNDDTADNDGGDGEDPTDDSGGAEDGSGETGGDDSDAGADDGGDEEFPLEGLGNITGDCNAINLPDDAGLLLHNAIDFGTDGFDASLLSHGGAELFEEGTLGGSSIHSEVVAFEVLHRCEIAFLIKSETEIEYIDAGGKKTDMLVELDGQNVGVSVTRAFKWGDDVVYTEEDAFHLLSDKLEDVLLSAANAAESNAWNHALLHVVTHDPSYIPSLEAAYATLPTSLTNETIVMMTVTDGNDDFIY